MTNREFREHQPISMRDSRRSRTGATAAVLHRPGLLRPDDRPFKDARSVAVLFVADLFHPVDILAVHRLLNGDMGHRGRRRRSVPMLQAGRKPDHIAGPNFLDRSALALNPAEARRDDQSLTERMRMPGAAGTRLECDVAATYARRIGRLEQRIDADRAGEIFRRSLAGRLRTASRDLHRSIPSL